MVPTSTSVHMVGRAPTVAATSWLCPQGEQQSSPSLTPCLSGKLSKTSKHFLWEVSFKTAFAISHKFWHQHVSWSAWRTGPGSDPISSSQPPILPLDQPSPPSASSHLSWSPTRAPRFLPFCSHVSFCPFIWKINTLWWKKIRLW